MKSYSKRTLSILFISFISFYSCNDNSQEATTPETQKDYFPNSNGSSYVYDLQLTDSLNNTMTGERSVNYNGSTTIDGKSYQILIDHFNYVVYSVTDSAYFRKTTEQVFYNTDNSQIMMLVPDSLRSLVVVDKEACLLDVPFTIGKSWASYKLAINFGILFNIVNVTANVESIENVSLTVNNQAFNKEAVKLKFQLAISLDISMPVQYYYAEVWMVENVGLVKLEGNSEAINFMIGNNLFAPGSHVKQTLKQYSIP
jgi:hypothetical protein